MISKKLSAFLEAQKIQYTPMVHKTVYTAYDAAQTLKVKLNEVAKVVVVHVAPKIQFGAGAKDYLLLVLPAQLRVDFAKVKKLLKLTKIKIIQEQVMTKVIKAKPGAVTPFALFYNLPVFIDKALLKTKSVLVSGGAYTDSLKVKVADLIKVGGKVLGSFGEKHKK